MHEGSWGYLKKELCPKQSWAKDETQTKCHCCDKQFLFFIRRKHHCRSCGKIFCSSCSSYFINGKYIDATYQKYLRLCEFCHKQIEKFIKQMDESPQFSRKQQQHKINTDSDEQIQEQQNNIQLVSDQGEFSENECLCHLNKQIVNKIQKATLYQCQSHSIGQNWIPIISKLAINATLQTRVDTLYNNNTMDITHYIKIKTLQTNQPNYNKAVKGFIASKNVSSKHMQTFFLKPKIMIIAKSIDVNSFSQSQINFQQIMVKQKHTLRKILDRLLKFQPDIVFVEQIVNIFALQYLQKHKVTVISKLKQKSIQRIKKVAKISKKVQKIWKIDKCKSSQIIGTCQKLYFKKYETEEQTKTIMFMEDDVGMTSILLGDNNNKLNFPNLKLIMKEILRISRHLCLEKFLVMTQVSKLNKAKVLGPGFFEGFLDEKYQQFLNTILLNRQKISYTKINFVNFKFFKFTDIQKPEIVQAYLKANNCQKIWRIKQQAQICYQPCYRDIKFYSKEDISLGTYILLKAANIDKKCKKCNKPKYNHNSLYYYGNTVIKIFVQNKMSSNRLRKPSLQIQNNQQQDIIITKQILPKYVKQKSKITRNIQFTISSYIQCEDCNLKLSENATLNRSYLEFSFLFFLLKLFTTVNQNKMSFVTEINSPQIKKKCAHTKRNRTFQYEDTHVKFLVEPLIKFKIDKISFLDPNSINYYNKMQQKFLDNLLKNECQTLSNLSNQLMCYLNAFHLPIQLSQSPRKHILKSLNKENLINQISKLKSILSKLNSQIHQYSIKDIKQQLKDTQDFTIVLRKSHQYFYMLNNIRRIVIDIEDTLKKGFKKQKQEIYENNLQLNNENQQNVTTDNNSLSSISIIMPQFFLKKIQVPNSILNIEKISEKYKQLRWTQDDFKQMNYIPIFREDPISFIGYALNSKTFSNSLLHDPVQKEIKVRIHLKNDFLFFSETKQSITEIQDNLKVQYSKKDYKDDMFEVTIFNHHEFQNIRNSQGITFNTFIKTIVGCSSWDNSGGKSGSKFAKSHNDLIVMKIINEKQFIEFRKFVSDYISYVNGQDKKNETLLTKIFGIFQVNIKGRMHNCIAMQNIFFQLNLKDHLVYDLKGSETNRFSPFIPNKSFTGLDTNFKIDRNAQPIPLTTQLYNQIMQTLDDDTKFLSDQAVIDYSLLLIINLQANTLRMGIIDFMRPYHIIEKIEKLYKEIKNNSTPTVIPPKQYSTRFMTAMRKYFMKIQDLKIKQK